MRIVELIVEGYSEQLEIDLSDLLAAAKGHEQSAVSVDMLVAQLTNLGHNVNRNSIMTILKSNPFVQTATPDEVQLRPDDEAAVGGDPAAQVDNAERVSQMADNAVDIG